MDTKSLWNTQARNLDKYIKEHLLPDAPLPTEFQSAFDTIISHLKNRCFQDTGKSVRVTKVVKGGSCGKGTALRNCSDIKLVVFLSNLKNYRDQIDHKEEFIEEIKNQLEQCEHEQEWMFKVKFEVTRQANLQVLHFMMMSKMHAQLVYVLPVFDVLGQLTRDLRKPDPHVYIDLIRESQAGGEFFTCFTELQNTFFSQRCTKLKNLIRLVKHWYRMCKAKIISLPPQHALELLTVYAWEHGSQEVNFSIARGFRTVLNLVQNYQELMIYWTINYDINNEIIAAYLCHQLQKHRPVILDPADPTYDVGGGSHWRWDKLAQEAQKWSSAPCFQNEDGSWVQPWTIPMEQTLEASNNWNLLNEP
ncbi:2'-5'-oligoadenylate synthase 1-like [Macrotis lagotis]|uniref:2'-5'-oligoadenylate synthase 1-like n=1 Tax=Macrotis lagotis TaxID=92651 RepID=UPI003D68BB5B